jgi:hypothetical protein
VDATVKPALIVPLPQITGSLSRTFMSTGWADAEDHGSTAGTRERTDLSRRARAVRGAARDMPTALTTLRPRPARSPATG